MDHVDFGRYLSQQRELRGMSREDISRATTTFCLLPPESDADVCMTLEERMSNSSRSRSAYLRTASNWRTPLLAYGGWSNSLRTRLSAIE